MDSFYTRRAYPAQIAPALELGTSLSRAALDCRESSGWTPQEVENRTPEPIPLPAHMHLRFVRDEDAESVIDLVAGIWSEYPGKVLNVLHDMPELLSPATAYARRSGLFWILEEGNEIAGTVAGIPSPDRSCIELQKLYVRRTSRKRGYGELLCGLVEHEAVRRSLNNVELWSDTKLLDAHRLYERLGYRRDEALRIYRDSSNTVRHKFSKTLVQRPAPFPKL